MKYIIKVSPEITIKSKPVRKRCIRLLEKNIKKHLFKFDGFYEIKSLWERIDLDISHLSDFSSDIEDIIKFIPWVHAIEKIEHYDFVSFDDSLEKVVNLYSDKIKWKKFRVTCKRSWKHDFKSIDFEKYIWGWVLENIEWTSVSLKDFDFEIKLNISWDKFYILKEVIAWIWGYPVWFQDKVLSLISGGFDSGVATYSLMKRWCEVDYLFFNLWWNAHELWVKQVSYDLWNRFSLPHKRARFITVNFEEVVSEILKNINHKYRWVVLKRYMLKVASMVAQDHYYALIKWDSLWQVSSQTLKNLHIVDKASDTLVLRPLISFNKQEIVDISKQIKTYDSAANMPEYCWVISDKPSTWARLEKVLEEEYKIDEKILKESFESRKIEFVKDMLKSNVSWPLVVEEIPNPEWYIVIDVRESIKIQKKPLEINSEVLEIPFFEINHRFKDLDQTKKYLLYCDKGIISKLHALYLKEKGFNNLSLLRF